MSFRNNFDLSVYFVADPACCAGRDLVDVVMQAAQGGVTMVQLRDKSGDQPQILARAAMLAEMLRPLNIPFLVNDDPEIAFAVGADGVHLGQGDMAPIEARRILGEEAIIGLTAFTPDHMAAVDPEIVDYVGTGPFFPTKTDKGKPVLGAAKFQEIAALSPVPVVGIGGIEHKNAARVIQAGANGVAMMRSISASPDPQQAAQQFVQIVKGAR